MASKVLALDEAAAAAADDDEPSPPAYRHRDGRRAAPDSDDCRTRRLRALSTPGSMPAMMTMRRPSPCTRERAYRHRERERERERGDDESTTTYDDTPPASA